MPRLTIYSIYLIWSCIGVLELHHLFGVWSGFGGQIHSLQSNKITDADLRGEEIEKVCC